MRKNRLRKTMTYAVIASLCSSLLLGGGFWKAPHAKASVSSYNYAEALQKSIYFYEAQRSGALPANNRVSWRGNSGMTDGADVGKDLTGGWYDAGDHVKFGLPMATSATLLAWSVYEYKDGYVQSGQYDKILENIKWATDYFIKAHTAPNELYVQVGNGDTDHQWWGPAEVMQMARPSYKITATCPGSDVAGETAAALAAASIVFKQENPSYSATLLTHAKQLYSFADTYRGKYSDCVPQASPFYTSYSGYWDELSWGAAWLYMATNDNSYLTKAISASANWGKEGQTQNWGYKWTHAWDDKHYGAELLLARITNDPQYITAIERNLDFWTSGTSDTKERVTYTPGGLAWLDTWGSLRYAMNASFLAFVYSDWVTDTAKKNKYRTFASNQVLYALGDNPSNRSYVIGFGNNPPQHPHHRTSHGSWADSQTVPVEHRHVLYGALVGGPNSSDQYTDSIADYTSNEVATDYNAAFTGNLAKMKLLYGTGQQPLANFPAPETKEDEMFVEASFNSTGPTYTEIKALVNNRSGWPARMGDKLSFNYYMDLSEVFSAGYGLSNLTVTTNYNQGATVSGLLPFDAANNIYYVKVDFTGTKIYPGGQPNYKKEVQFRIAAPSGTTFWNPNNDFSAQGLISSSTSAKTVYIPLYDNGVKVFGNTPGPVAPQPPAAPTGLTAKAGNAQATLSWTASSGATSYTVKRATTSGGPYTAVATGVTSTTYANTGLTNGTTYYYVVSAVNGVGESANSSQVSVTPTAPQLPAAPTGLIAAAGNAQATLSWTASSGATSYTVKRAATSGGPYTAVATGVTTTSYTNTGLTNGTTYYYVVSAVNAVGESANSAQVSAAPSAGSTGSLVAQYKANNTNATDNQIGPHFNIKNTGTTAVSLSNLKLRYYFTKDTSASLNFYCDYAQVGTSNVSGAFVTINPAKTGADTYLEISFNSAAGTIAAGGQSGDIQVRIAKSDWSNFNEADDYSFDGTKTSYVDWNKVTVYQNGTLVYGIEP
ncbi:glycoside hydrolase [Cohnella endophytica]|uniref:Endoglucanase n=1 Tax=Cohnella endophytica TaxID=2419778 RepID=A0A494XYH8_9BACL|nr:glycoside hydrolase family 9 protein [Cohnella endophytica]RKP53164.1 glycoside hydrolase [Cohnella endophytica]